MSKTIKIFDTTLRDGEQSPGAAMTQEEKIAIARTLDDMGVNIIEAGFPFANPADFEAVKAISNIVKNATICGLARAKKTDIEAAAQATAGAPQSRIHTSLISFHTRDPAFIWPEISRGCGGWPPPILRAGAAPRLVVFTPASPTRPARGSAACPHE